MGIWVMPEEEHVIHTVLQFSFYLHLFCKLRKGSLRGDRMGTSLSWLLLFLCSLFLDYWFPEALCWTSGWKREEWAIAYLYTSFSLLLFLTPLQTPPKHLLNITMLVSLSWCVFWRNALISCQVPRSEQIWFKLPYLAFKVNTSLLILVIPA